MIESELAFDKDGERFVVSDKATDWRANRLRGGRGAPEIVYGRDGGPATIPIDGNMEDLRALVSEVIGESCRIRLDAIDADGKAVADVPRAYVQVTLAPRNASVAEAPIPPNLSSTDHAIRELVRANCELVRANSELAKTVATQQSAVVLAAAELLRAADGAGLSRREPIEYFDDEGDDDDEEEAPAQPGSDWVSVAHEALATAKMVAAAVMTKRQGGPATDSAATTGTVAPDSAAPTRTSASVSTAPEAAPAPSRVPVNPHAHLLAIQAQLTPAESAFVMGVISKLTPEDRAQWTEQLTDMSVAEAVTLIRTQIEKRKEKAS